MTSQNQQPSNTAIEPVLKYVTCPGASKKDAQTHRMAYWSWGDEQNPRILLCVHGLSRQGRDFDTLARELSAHYHVICPDVVGRGVSDWLAESCNSCALKSKPLSLWTSIGSAHPWAV